MQDSLRMSQSLLVNRSPDLDRPARSQQNRSMLGESSCDVNRNALLSREGYSQLISGDLTHPAMELMHAARSSLNHRKRGYLAWAGYNIR